MRLKRGGCSAEGTVNKYKKGIVLFYRTMAFFTLAPGNYAKSLMYKTTEGYHTMFFKAQKGTVTGVQIS